MNDLLLILIVIAIGFFAGTANETRHYNSIKSREKDFLHLPAVTIKKFPDDEPSVQEINLVYGSTVISEDAFKSLLAGLKNLFGGRLSSYETLVDRARRESILRMKEMAKGADIIYNLRIETTFINNSGRKRKGAVGVAAIAYGTAITYGKY